MVVEHSFNIKNDLSIFAFTDAQEIANNICKELGIERGKLEERPFEDGEH